MTDRTADTLTVDDLMIALKALCDRLNNNQGIQYQVVFGNGVKLFVDGQFITSGLERVAAALLGRQATPWAQEDE